MKLPQRERERERERERGVRVSIGGPMFEERPITIFLVEE